MILLAVQASKRAYKYESQQKIKRTRFFESYVRMGVIDVIVVTGMSGTDRSFRPSHGDLDANLRQWSIRGAVLLIVSTEQLEMELGYLSGIKAGTLEFQLAELTA